jgi:hypothetical protein
MSQLLSSRFLHQIPKPFFTTSNNMPVTLTALTAEYSAPGSSKPFSHALPSCTTESTKEKSAYLSALRASVVRLQDEVNVFLTSRMEEDKALAFLAGRKGDDRKEEQNYGEELVDEDD